MSMKADKLLRKSYKRLCPTGSELKFVKYAGLGFDDIASLRMNLRCYKLLNYNEEFIISTIIIVIMALSKILEITLGRPCCVNYTTNYQTSTY